MLHVETELEHEVELGQGGVTSDKESTPDERTDASQDDAQLIDVWMGLLLFHAQSVRRHTPCFKGSPRYLAVSFVRDSRWRRCGDLSERHTHSRNTLVLR